jgi:hypothetical protein
MSMSEPSSLSGYPRRGGGQDKSACHRLSMVSAPDDLRRVPIIANAAPSLMAGPPGDSTPTLTAL